MNATLDLQLHNPEMPVLDLSRCYTRPVSHLTAARMVERYHYAHRVPSIVAAVGMYVDDVLAGVCCYGTPPNRNGAVGCMGEEYAERVWELTRLFIHDWAGRNSESWLIGQSFAWLADRWPQCAVLLSYADPDFGHLGCIYQATNWLYTGLSADVGAVEAVVRGHQRSSKWVYDRYGTQDSARLAEFGVTLERVQKSRKHRYVTFLGDRRLKRTLRAALRWPVLPYPKGEATP